MYTSDELKWSTLPEQKPSAAIAVVIKRATLIGGVDVSTGKVTDTLSTWYEEYGRWIQVLLPMPTERFRPAVIYQDNFLLVTGGVAEDVSTVLNTTDVLDLTTTKWSTPEGLRLPIPLHQHIAWPFAESTYSWWAGLQCILGNHQKITTPRRGEQSGVMSSRLQPHSTPSHKGVYGPE